MKKNLLLFAMALLPLFVQGAVGIDNIYYELYSSPSGNTAAVWRNVSKNEKRKT